MSRGDMKQPYSEADNWFIGASFIYVSVYCGEGETGIGRDTEERKAG